VNELYSEQAKIAGRFLAEHASGDGRSFVWDQPRGRRRGRGDGQLNNLFRLKDMRGSDAGTCAANIESLGKLNEINSQGIGAPQEYGNLNANAWVLPLVGGSHRFLSIQDLT